MNLKTLTLSLALLMTGALNAMEEAGTSSASQKQPRTIFNLNIEASLVNKQNELLSKRALNCTAYDDDTVTEHYNHPVPFVTDVSSASAQEAATQYGTEIKMAPVFECSDFKSKIVNLQVCITKKLNGKTETLQLNQRIKFIVVGIKETKHEKRIDCAEDLTLKITAKRSLSILEAQALARGIPIDFFD
jgi:hypothetical protein